MKPTRVAAIALLLAGSGAWSQPPDAPASDDQASEKPSPQQPPPEDAQDPQPAEVQDDQQPAEPATNPQAADVASVASDQAIDRGVVTEWKSWGGGRICFSDGSEIHFYGDSFYETLVVTHPGTPPIESTYAPPMPVMTIDITRAGGPRGNEYIEFTTSRGQTGPEGPHLRFRVTRSFFNRPRVVLLGREERGPEFQDPHYTFPGEGSPCRLWW
jgi:hypothetical protein